MENGNLTITELDIDKRIKELMSDVLQLRLDAIDDELSMKNCDRWDSLMHMEIITSLEDDFEINLDFDEIVKMQSVREIKEVIMAAIG